MCPLSNRQSRLGFLASLVAIFFVAVIGIQSFFWIQRLTTVRRSEIVWTVDVIWSSLHDYPEQPAQDFLQVLFRHVFFPSDNLYHIHPLIYEIMDSPFLQNSLAQYYLAVPITPVFIAEATSTGFYRTEKNGRVSSLYLRRLDDSYVSRLGLRNLCIGAEYRVSDIIFRVLRQNGILVLLGGLLLFLLFTVFFRVLRSATDISRQLSYVFQRIADDPNEALDAVYPQSLKSLEGGVIYFGFEHMLDSLRTARFRQEESEDRFRRLFSDSRDAILLTNGMFVLECNQQSERFFQLGRDRLVGSDVRNLLAPLGEELMHSLLNRAVDGETVSDSLILPGDGQMERAFDLVIHPQYLGMEFGFQIVLHDITSIHQTERMLQILNENLYRTLYSIGDGIIVSDAEGRITRMNKVAEELTEWSQQEAYGKHLSEIVQLRELGSGVRTVCSLEIILDDDSLAETIVEPSPKEMRTRWGRMRYVSETGAPVRSADDVITGGVVVFRDVGSQLTMERELRENQRILSMVLDHATVGVGAFSRRGQFMYANPMLCSMLGYSAMELRNKRFDKMIHPEDLRRNIRFFRRLMMATGQESFEIRYITRDGSQRYAVLSGGGVKVEENENQGFVVVIVQDTTEIKRAEQENQKKEQLLIQAEKLAALGELSAGMAHEINQPLTGISMAADNLQFLAAGQVPDRSLNAEYVQEKTEHIHDYVDRIRSIIEHVRTFSREQMQDEKEPFQPRLAVQNAISLVAAQYRGHGIELILDVQTVPAVFGNLYRLEQVVLNLLTNARDAVNLRKQQSGEGFRPFIQVRMYAQKSQQAGQQVSIVIIDNGTGILAEQIGSVFDPFFTTKPVDQGTGLGLSVAYGIVQEMGGEIILENNEYGGSTAIVRLPIADFVLGND